MFQEMDADGNGSVEKSEFFSFFEDVNNDSDETLEELFAKVDADGDGKISEEEDEEFRATMDNMRPSGPPPSGQAKPSGSGQKTGGSSGSGNSSDSDTEYDVMDTNEDGTVSALEEMLYYQAHPNEKIKSENDIFSKSNNTSNKISDTFRKSVINSYENSSNQNMFLQQSLSSSLSSLYA
jgi:Ca2+-binding EF-hand superfamily protein